MMIPDVRFDAGDWVDLYALVQWAPGTEMVLVNKLQQNALAYIGTGKPATSSVDGVPLLYGIPWRVTSGSSGCWVKMIDAGTGAQGRLCVQQGAS